MSHAAGGRSAVSRVGLVRRIPPPRPASEDATEQILTNDPLCLVRRVGYLFLGAQLAAFLAWSTLLYSRYALTPDFAQYHQAWYLIAHGDLNPRDTLGRFQFWQNHAEFMMWPMALLYWVWPHCVVLLWLQDIGVVIAETVAFTWLCEIASGRHASRPDAAATSAWDARWLAGVGLVLLVANPWIWWGISFDYHFETIGIAFTALLAWDLANGRRRAWWWVLPLLACGDVTGTYLAGIGLGGVLAGRGLRRRGVILACLGVAAVLFITLIHGNRGSAHGLQAYAYLAVPGAKATGHLPLTSLVMGIATHPGRVLATLWGKRVDLWANLAPSGLAGLGYLALLPLILVVALANSLFHGVLFAEPLFQSLPAYVFLPVATVGVLRWVTVRRRWLGLALTGLVVAQAVGWAVVWGGHTEGWWLRVPTSSAAVLARAEAMIPASAEVVVSQGVVGRFADRADVRILLGPGYQPVNQPDVWFVVLPEAGVETQSTGSAMALVGQLAGSMHARLVTHASGVWVFDWQPPAGVRRILVPGLAPVGAWTTPGAAGHAVLAGGVRRWHVTSNGGRGYVVSGLAWQVLPRRYQATVWLSASGPVNVEVWDDTGNVLLARRVLPGASGTERVVLPVDATTPYRAHEFSGWGPFTAHFIAPPVGQRIEVRVWSPGGETVNVYSAQLLTVSH
jgi:hypothetical protein